MSDEEREEEADPLSPSREKAPESSRDETASSEDANSESRCYYC